LKKKKRPTAKPTNRSRKGSTASRAEATNKDARTELPSESITENTPKITPSIPTPSTLAVDRKDETSTLERKSKDRKTLREKGLSATPKSVLRDANSPEEKEKINSTVTKEHILSNEEIDIASPSVTTKKKGTKN